MARDGKLDVNPDAFLQYSVAANFGGLIENIATNKLSLPILLGFGSLAGSLAVFLYYRHKGDRWMCSGMHLVSAALFPVFALAFGIVTKIVEIIKNS